MRIPRKVVKYLRGLPDWLIVLGLFAVWIIIIFSVAYSVIFLTDFFRGVFF